MAMGVVGLFTNLNILFFVNKKNTGKMVRAQGKHREFGINWSVATLVPFLGGLSLHLNHLIG